MKLAGNPVALLEHCAGSHLLANDGHLFVQSSPQHYDPHDYSQKNASGDAQQPESVTQIPPRRSCEYNDILGYAQQHAKRLRDLPQPPATNQTNAGNLHFAIQGDG